MAVKKSAPSTHTHRPIVRGFTVALDVGVLARVYQTALFMAVV